MHEVQGRWVVQPVFIGRKTVVHIPISGVARWKVQPQRPIFKHNPDRRFVSLYNWSHPCPPYQEWKEKIKNETTPVSNGTWSFQQLARRDASHPPLLYPLPYRRCAGYAVVAPRARDNLAPDHI